MMTTLDPNATVDLDALHDAITNAIKAQYPSLVTVEFYRTEERKNLPCPAVLLDLTEFENEPDLDVGTGQIAMSARFDAEIVFGFKTPNVKREIRKFAASFASWLYLRRWEGITSDAAKVVGCYKDEFDPRMDEYEVWRVEWTQVLYLGCNAWNDTSAPLTVGTGYPADGTALTTTADDGTAVPFEPQTGGTMAGYDPNIGPAHVADYVPLETNTDIIKPTE
jgi:hypothetical protein